MSFGQFRKGGVQDEQKQNKKENKHIGDKNRRHKKTRNGTNK